MNSFSIRVMISKGFLRPLGTGQFVIGGNRLCSSMTLMILVLVIRTTTTSRLGRQKDGSWLESRHQRLCILGQTHDKSLGICTCIICIISICLRFRKTSSLESVIPSRVGNEVSHGLNQVSRVPDSTGNRLSG